jgi:hypothetical protein
VRAELGGYRHRANEARPSRERESKDALLNAIALHRQRLTQCRALIRRQTALRNEAIAQAIEDGLRISTVAAAAGETVHRVRAIALSFDDLDPSPTAADEHLATLRRIASDLQEAMDGKTGVEAQLGALAGYAYRSGFTDEGHLAGITGLSHDSIRQTLRRLSRQRRTHTTRDTRKAADSKDLAAGTER